MATDIRSLPSFLNSDADFRAWGSGVAAQIAAMGLVQTADTGQVNWTTITKGAINTFPAYEIYRFNDSLQATRPVYLKVEYGQGSVLGRPALGLTVGSATNGAGTITGQVGTRQTAGATSTGSAGDTRNSYCSGTTSRLTLASTLDPAGTALLAFLHVGRPRNSAGTETDEGIVTHVAGTAASAFQVVPAAGSVPAAGGGASVQPFLDLATGGHHTAAGAEVVLAPLLVGAGGKLRFGTLCSYKHTDIGELVSFTATLFGVTHTFLPLGDGGPLVRGTGNAMAMLWE